MCDEATSLSRRGFVRLVGLAAGSGVAAGVVSCRPDRARSDADASPLTGRPILTEWADGIVQVETPARELPIAYVSMAHRLVFVDPEFRDRATFDAGGREPAGEELGADGDDRQPGCRQ